MTNASIDTVEIANVDGIGLELKGVQNSEFRTMEVRKCGKFSSSLPGARIYNLSGFDSQSLSFFGSLFERNHFHACTVESAYDIGFIRTKFHGRLTSDDTTPNAVNLLHLTGAARIIADACQFSNARQYAIFAGDTSGVESSGLIGSCTFEMPANYQTSGQAWNIVIAKGRFLLNQNYFGNGTHSSYTSLGGDIWLQSTVVDIGGANLHLGNGATRIKRDSSNVFRQPSISGIEYASPINKTVLSVAVQGDSNNRLNYQSEGEIWFGSGAATVDCAIVRKSANTLGLPDGDTWQIQGTWNGGVLKLRNYSLWVDANGKLRIFDGTPTSDTVGDVVGGQS